MLQDKINIIYRNRGQLLEPEQKPTIKTFTWLCVFQCLHGEENSEAIHKSHKEAQGHIQRRHTQFDPLKLMIETN